MSIFIVPTPENVMERKQRVPGWTVIKLDRKAKREWLTLIAQLKDKGVTHVYSSDLDTEAGQLLASELRVPFKHEFELRRFRIGRFHGIKLADLGMLMERLEGKWKRNPAIPVREGDSLISFQRRFARRFNTLLGQTESIAFVTDPLTIAYIKNGMDAKALIPNGNPVNRGKIYKVGRG
jgi:broad specificity phosphatase PhoE